MKKNALAAVIGSILAAGWSAGVVAQDTNQQDQNVEKLESVEVTGSRITKAQMEGMSPVLTITREDIENQGFTSLADILQRLPIAGSALNTRFNSSGNFGFPPDGGGIGAGASQISLRSLGAKRTLVLVDGMRWVAGSSASGVSNATDLNTIPVGIIDHIDVLEDGASTLYGSDAIAGVVNVITRKDYSGFEATGYFGQFGQSDGETTRLEVNAGQVSDRMSVYFGVSYTDGNSVSANDRSISRFPAPGTGLTRGSSGTPEGRFIFTDPNTGTTVNLARNPGAPPIPVFDPLNPGGGADDFNPWDNSDRFNFSQFNLLVTPSQRTNVFADMTYNLSDDVQYYVKAMYNQRKSTNQAAPEPIFIGNGAGTGGIADTVNIDVTNPFNPLGFTLSAADNFILLGRRPIEGGPRVFDQDVDTKYLGSGFKGDFNLGERFFTWDANFVYSENNANQVKTGGYNIARIATALGPLSVCQATPGCVPLNLFGGQGADGQGTITPEMLNYIQFVQQDASRQMLRDYTFNLSGDLLELPGGTMAFAVGYESRTQKGSFLPDAVVTAGETNGVPSSPTLGSFNVDEFYAELNVPVLADMPFAKLLEFDFALRVSDYNTSGSSTTHKAGFRWRPVDDLLVRGTFSEGLRAPSVGELFGTGSRFDATLTDPCSNATDPTILANCGALGVPDPATFEQINPQISVVTGGNDAINPETSDSYTFGLVYSPEWAEATDWASKLDFEFTFYRHDLEGTISALDAQTQLNNCVATTDPLFCGGISRSSSGQVAGFQNRLQNLGALDTQGWDLNIHYISPDFEFGRFDITMNNTIVGKFVEASLNGKRKLDGIQTTFEGIDAGIPQYKGTLNINWIYHDFAATWTVRYIGKLIESCSDFLDGTINSFTQLGLCSNPNTADDSLSTNTLGGITYNDLQVTWNLPFFNQYKPSVKVGVINLFDKDPPLCESCSLNGHDPSVYDPPGVFWYVQTGFRFE